MKELSIMDRRAFIKSSLVGAGALALPKLTISSRAAAPKKAAVLKLGSQESKLPGASLKEKVANLEKWGGCGLELHGNPATRIAEIKDAIKGTTVRVSALCWGSCKGDLVSPDLEKRKQGIQQIKDALDTAGELESTGVIFVPCFHKQSDLKPAELDQILFDILPGIGDHAVKRGTRVLLEPLTKLETFYINRIEQAAAICAKVNHPGICLMGDFYHMSREETDQTQAFVTGGPWLHHVHLATGKTRILPGLEPHSYVEGFKGLKKVGYQDYCSIECAIKKGTDPAVAIPQAFDFLRQQWKEATI
ncbi:MAG: sugar phosphate isomerase/epimerase [Verrucomicrobiae bacterium]|nr:sugar phosphate isomerase/epimerase [Verrucomicrobiae bacterium]